MEFLTLNLYALAAAQGIFCWPVPIGHPQGLGLRERYHSVILRLYSGAKAYHPSITDEYALGVALKALNETMGIDGITPTLLVYVVRPNLLLPGAFSTSMPKHRRPRVQKLARDEYTRIVDEQRLKAVQKAKCPSVVSDLLWGDSAVVYG